MTKKELSENFGIKYHTFLRLCKKYNCNTEEEIRNAIELDKQSKKLFNVGDKYNHFTIISDETKLINRLKHILVKCDCGNEVWRAWSDIKYGKRKCCGKCKGQYLRIPIEIGSKYGRLTVIEGPIYGRQKNHLVYKCQCECGNICYNTSTDLTRGNATLCRICGLAQGRLTRIKNNEGIVKEPKNILNLTQFNKIKRGAKVRNIEFSISIPYLWELYEKQNRKCALTGVDLPNIKEASLDRIDSFKGYIEGNVQWTIAKANIAKQQLSTEEFVELCRKVVNHANQQPSLSLTTEEGSETNS